MNNEQRPKWMYPLVGVAIIVMLFYPATAPFATWVKWLAVGALLGGIVKIMSFIPSKNQSDDEPKV